MVIGDCNKQRHSYCRQNCGAHNDLRSIFRIILHFNSNECHINSCWDTVGNDYSLCCYRMHWAVEHNKEYSDKIKKIKEDIQLYEEEKETIKNNDTDWMNIFKKKEKINELNRLLIDELIEDIVVSEDGNIKVIFKYEDKYFEALDFINKQKYDIILSS